MARIISYSAYLQNPPTGTNKEVDLVVLCPTDTCFFCGQPLGDDLVYWQGISQLWLHPKCAFLFGWNLIKDAYPQKS